jgi:hypothetical protein
MFDNFEVTYNTDPVEITYRTGDREWEKSMQVD